jgi:hypothetical protein
MIKMTTAVLGAAIFAFAGSSAFAQSTPLSSTEQQSLRNCESLPHNEMMTNADCAALFKAHPGLVSGRSATGADVGTTQSVQPNGTDANAAGMNGSGAAGAGAGH